MKRSQFLTVWIVFLTLTVQGVNPVVPIDTAHWYMQHSYDVQQYKLEVDLYNNYTSPFPKTFTAKEIITFRVDSTLNSIKLNAVSSSLEIDSVRLAGVSFTRLNDTLKIQRRRAYSPGAVVQVKVCYRHKAIADQAFYVSNGFVFTDFPPEGARIFAFSIFTIMLSTLASA